MKAAIYPGKGKSLSIEKMEIPTPNKNEVLIEVKYCGISELDLPLTSNSQFDYEFGKIGREFPVEFAKLEKTLRIFERARTFV